MTDNRELILKDSIPVTESGCWLWLKGSDRDGYGLTKVIKANGKKSTARAHRVSYEAFIGRVPDGLMLLHSCDVRGCVNPDHLTPGNAKQNAKDMIARGRQLKGELNPAAKLTEANIYKMIELYKTGQYTYQQIGEQFGVSRGTAHAAMTGRKWKHLLGDAPVASDKEHDK